MAKDYEQMVQDSRDAVRYEEITRELRFLSILQRGVYTVAIAVAASAGYVFGGNGNVEDDIKGTTLGLFTLMYLATGWGIGKTHDKLKQKIESKGLEAKL